MRRLCLLALLAAPAYPNACTLSTSYTLSASAGHWTGGCATIPGNGDTATLGNGVALVVNQNWIIGASGANNSTPAIQVGSTSNTLMSSVEVQAGVTLTARGDILYPKYGVAGNTFILDAASILAFDSSNASAPASTRYRLGFNEQGSGATAYVAFNGAAASPVTVTSCAVGNTSYCGSPSTPGLPGQFRAGNNTVGVAADTYMLLNATYTNFSYIGDSLSYGEAFAPCVYPGGSASMSLTHSTLDHTGPWAGCGSGPNFGAAATVNISGNTWTNSTCAAASSGCFPMYNETPTTGTYLFQNNVFDFCIGLAANQYAFDWSGSYLGNGVCANSYSYHGQSNLFVHQTADVGAHPFGGNASSWSLGYYFLDRTQDNPHWTGFPVATTVSNWIFDDPDNPTTDSGEIFNASCSGTCAETLQNSIHVPSKTGQGTSELDSTTNAAPTNASSAYTLDHNTWVGATAVGAFAMQQVNESGASLMPIANLESNLAWSNGGRYCKVGTVQTALGMLNNAVTMADYNYGDANALQAGTGGAPSCSDGMCTNGTCANQGNSYLAKWSATPGTHDVDVLHPTVLSPYLADPTRNLAGWDTAYLGHALGAQWTSGLGTVAYGAIVSDANASYWGVYKTGVNYRCVLLAGCNTATANTEPLVGTNWRTQWEFVSLYDIRSAIGSGKVYTDGAVGCASGCSAVQALVGWVQKGYTPQNPALWCAGHDGETVGAVPFCAKGKVMLGTLAGL